MSLLIGNTVWLYIFTCMSDLMNGLDFVCEEARREKKKFNTTLTRGQSEQADVGLT